MILERTISILAWSIITIFLYLIFKKAHQAYRHWWTMPIITTPIAIAAIITTTNLNYNNYISGAGWLITMIQVATVAFAIPIYEQRELIRKFYKILLIGVICGSAISISSIIFVTNFLNLEDYIKLSIIPYSITTPFAINISKIIGGKAELTAIFVATTGIIGSIIGEIILYKIPLKSSIARGSAFGISSHVVGSNKAFQINKEEGSIAALTMILTGIFNSLIAPLLQLII